MKIEHELYFSKSISKIKEYDDRILKYEFERKEEGVAITAFYKNNVGYFYCSSLDKQLIEIGIKNASYWAITDGIPAGYCLNDKCGNPIENYKTTISEAEEEKWRNIDNLLEKHSVNPIKRVKAQMLLSDIHITNSADFDCGYSSVLFYLNCLLSIQKTLYSFTTIGHNVEELLDNLRDSQWIKMRNDDIICLSTYPVGEHVAILSSTALASIVSVFSNIFIGKDRVKRTHLINELSQGAGILDMYDDGLCVDGFASAPFDCEARDTQITYLIVDGQLKQMLWDAADENQFGEKSTGNKMKNSYNERSYISPTNIIIQGRKTTNFKNLISYVDRGYIIDKVYIIPGGINSTTGQFKINASGYYINGGEKKGYISRFTISGDFVELLRHVDMASVEREWVLTGSAIYSPSVYISKLYIL